jgi:nonsense-mediated mRNA decay protein 3
MVFLRYKTSQELISHDTHNNTFQYKHTFSVEIVPVCKVKEPLDSSFE